MVIKIVLILFQTETKKHKHLQVVVTYWSVIDKFDKRILEAGNKQF